MRLPFGTSGQHRCAGFTYLLVLVLVAILMIMSGAGTLMISNVVKREKENEVLFRGHAYIQAICSYYQAGKTVKQLPRNLDDLLQDPRYALRRHIRVLYDDPISGREWQLIRSEDGGIQGVVSSSDAAPLKRAFFPPGLETFEEATSYSEWHFRFEEQKLGRNGDCSMLGRIMSSMTESH